MDVETEPIHFTQDDHHSIQERPTHDASIGSRTHGYWRTRSKKGVESLSHLFSDLSPSSDLRAENKVLTVARLYIEPTLPKVESEPVGDPVVSDPCIPGGCTCLATGP